MCYPGSSRRCPEKILRILSAVFSALFTLVYIVSAPLAMMLSIIAVLAILVLWPYGATYLCMVLTGETSKGSACRDICSFLGSAAAVTFPCCKKSSTIHSSEAGSAADKFLETRKKMAVQVRKTCLVVWICLFCFPIGVMLYVMADAGEVRVTVGNGAFVCVQETECDQNITSGRLCGRRDQRRALYRSHAECSPPNWSSHYSRVHKIHCSRLVLKFRRQKTCGGHVGSINHREQCRERCRSAGQSTSGQSTSGNALRLSDSPATRQDYGLLHTAQVHAARPSLVRAIDNETWQRWFTHVLMISANTLFDCALRKNEERWHLFPLCSFHAPAEKVRRHRRTPSHHLRSTVVPCSYAHTRHNPRTSHRAPPGVRLIYGGAARCVPHFVGGGFLRANKTARGTCVTSHFTPPSQHDTRGGGLFFRL